MLYENKCILITVLPVVGDLSIVAGVRRGAMAAAEIHRSHERTCTCVECGYPFQNSQFLDGEHLMYMCI